MTIPKLQNLLEMWKNYVHYLKVAWPCQLLRGMSSQKLLLQLKRIQLKHVQLKRIQLKHFRFFLSLKDISITTETD